MLYQKNKETFSRASERGQLAERWKEALSKGIYLAEEIKIPFMGERSYSQTKRLYLRKSVFYLVITLLFSILEYVVNVFREFHRIARFIDSSLSLYWVVSIFLMIGILIFGRRAWKAFRLFFKYRDIQKDIRKISQAVVQSLYKVRVIKTPLSELEIVVFKDVAGAVYCHLMGGKNFERFAFIEALKEIVSPIRNPRYIIVRKGKFLGVIHQEDYHVVPEILASNKKRALLFQKYWEEFVGDNELVFTRTTEGRQYLLQSRMKSLAAQLGENRVEYLNRWR